LFRYFSKHELRELFVLDDHRQSKTQIQLEKMHSAHRVTDTSLDKHVAFLYSTDIFGISDHDLLFTKEAVATEEELSAASEMSDAIQAKVASLYIISTSVSRLENRCLVCFLLQLLQVRRAADIMQAESSHAMGRFTPASVGSKKKTQTRIEDHAMEVFIPSKEDSRRFKPGKKVVKVSCLFLNSCSHHLLTTIP
jgi:hypothetical protein